MKRTFILLFVLIFSIEAKALVFRVASYNIKGLPYPIQTTHISRYKKISAEIRKMVKAGNGPDVILIQEAFSGFTNYLSRSLRDLYPYRAKGPLFKIKWNSGLLVLSRHPLTWSGKVPFSSCDSFDCLARKGVAYVRVKTPENVEIDLYDTHMQADNDGRDRSISTAVRVKQTETMIDFMNYTHDGDLPFFMAGDFNTRPQDPNYGRFLQEFGDIETWTYCQTHSTCTGFNQIPARDWERKIDHIFYHSGKARVTPLDYEIFFADTDYSDHDMILGTYLIEP